jgi:hypothetical protein
MMKTPYGQFKRGKKPTQPTPEKIVIKIPGHHSFEQLAVELQKAIARLASHGAYGVEDSTFYVWPGEAAGKRFSSAIPDRHTLPQFSFELQKAIGRLQDKGLASVENCELHVRPADQKGGRMALWNAQGQPITELEISPRAATPAYREGH